MQYENWTYFLKHHKLCPQKTQSYKGRIYYVPHGSNVSCPRSCVFQWEEHCLPGSTPQRWQIDKEEKMAVSFQEIHEEGEIHCNGHFREADLKKILWEVLDAK